MPRSVRFTSRRTTVIFTDQLRQALRKACAWYSTASTCDPLWRTYDEHSENCAHRSATAKSKPTDVPFHSAQFFWATARPARCARLTSRPAYLLLSALRP